MNALRTRQQMLDVVRSLCADLDAAIAEAGDDRMETPGSFGPWTFKDLIAHLTGWRLLTATRLESGMSGREPEIPWPAHLDEGDDLDTINDWFFQESREKPVEQVIAESNQTFDRVQQALTTIAEEDLLTPGRFAWLHGTDEALGPAVIGGTENHYRVDHEPELRQWLAAESP